MNVLTAALDTTLTTLCLMSGSGAESIAARTYTHSGRFLCFSFRAQLFVRKPFALVWPLGSLPNLDGASLLPGSARLYTRLCAVAIPAASRGHLDTGKRRGVVRSEPRDDDDASKDGRMPCIR